MKLMPQARPVAVFASSLVNEVAESEMTLPIHRQSVAFSLGYPGPYDDEYRQYQPAYDEPVIPAPPGYQTHAPQVGSLARRLTGPSYEDLAMRDSCYPVERQASGLGFYPNSHPSVGIPLRQRRHSTVSFAHRPPPMDTFRRLSSIHIKFKRKGSLLSGISLRDAQSHTRLSNDELYTVHDLHANYKGRIFVKIQWAGYPSLTYEIPVEGYDGRVSLQTMARRISRACVHYLQANIIPVPWHQVILHHIEETAYGVWQPRLSTR